MTLRLPIDPNTTTFLFMDFQDGVLPFIGSLSGGVLNSAAAVLNAAREAGATVAFARFAFRPGYPEVADGTPLAGWIKSSGGFLIDSPETQIVSELAPRATEPVIVKNRGGAFVGTDLGLILRANCTETLVLLGITTGGVVLSTVRHAADEDYRIVVVEDACADPDPDVHRVLMEKVFPQQATVTGSAAVVAALACQR